MLHPGILEISIVVCFPPLNPDTVIASPDFSGRGDPSALSALFKVRVRYQAGYRRFVQKGFYTGLQIRPKLSVSAQENRSNTAITHYFK